MQPALELASGWGWNGEIFFSAAWCREAFSRLGVQAQSLMMILFLLLVGRKKMLKEKIKRNGCGALFPRAGNALLGVLYGIFMAVRCK
jgi:hypothetical protein